MFHNIFKFETSENSSEMKISIISPTARFAKGVVAPEKVGADHQRRRVERVEDELALVGLAAVGRRPAPAGHVEHDQ